MPADDLTLLAQGDRTMVLCFEVAPLQSGGIAVRDSKDPMGPVRRLATRREWVSFLDGLDKGEFDHVI